MKPVLEPDEEKSASEWATAKISKMQCLEGNVLFYGILPGIRNA